MSMPGPPHIEPPRWPGHSSTSAGSVSRRSRSERKMPRAPSAFSIARSGRATSLTNRLSPVSTAHGSLAAAGVDQRERACAPGGGRACAGRGSASAPSANSSPSSNGSCSYVGRGVAVDVDRRARGRRQAAVAGHVVGVVVGLEDVLDAQAHVAGQLEVLVDLEARVDDRGDARLLVADEVGRAAEVVVGDLAEDHGRIVRPTPPRDGCYPGTARRAAAEYLPRRCSSAPAQAGAPRLRRAARALRRVPRGLREPGRLGARRRRPAGGCCCAAAPATPGARSRPPTRWPSASTSELDRRLDIVARALQRLDSHRMAADVETMIQALRRGLVDAADFAR